MSADVIDAAIALESSLAELANVLREAPPDETTDRVSVPRGPIENVLGAWKIVRPLLESDPAVGGALREFVAQQALLENEQRRRERAGVGSARALGSTDS